MSTTLPPTTAATAIAASTSPSTLKANLETAARNGATDVPMAIQTLTTLVPDLAPKALVYSKSPWGTVAVSVIMGLAAKYGLACGAVATANCWSESTVDMMVGLAMLVGTVIGSYIMRAVTKVPTSGILSVPTAP